MASWNGLSLTACHNASTQVPAESIDVAVWVDAVTAIHSLSRVVPVVVQGPLPQVVVGRGIREMEEITHGSNLGATVGQAALDWEACLAMMDCSVDGEATPRCEEAVL